MADDANPPRRTPDQEGADEQRLAELADDLVAVVERAVPPWIERLVVDRIAAWHGRVSDQVAVEAREAGVAARDEVVPRLRSLLATDIDDQRANPLAMLREATRHAHGVLAAHDVPPVRRDEFAERSFPDDTYGLVPATWGDIHPDLHDAGIAWGAAKAYVFKARRRDEGRR